MTIADHITDRALEIGFDVVGIIPAGPAEHLPFYLGWLEAGYHGTQHYLARADRIARRRDLNMILPGVQSLVVVGLDYWPGPAPPEADNPGNGRISCYAQGPDYHHIMLPMLETLLESIQARAAPPVRGRAYVDTGPLLERDHARAAGLGFIGKNCNLIRPRAGSWLFLGILLLDLSVEPARSHPLGTAPVHTSVPGCGNCHRCLEACPTGALLQPFTLDSRRCISYFTTALKGEIPREMRPSIGNHIFGCDICQIVCPWNRFARPARLPAPDELATTPQGARQVRPPIHPAPSLLKLLDLDHAAFQYLFGHTPIGHLGYDLFLRNVAVAVGNWGAAEAVSPLGRIMLNSDPLVRQHVAWALGAIGGAAAGRLLRKALAGEDNPVVVQEIRWSLARRPS